MVKIFIAVDPDDNDNGLVAGKYKPSRIPKKCDICSILPTLVYKFKASWLCEECFNAEVKRFGFTVNKEERPNSNGKKKQDE